MFLLVKVIVYFIHVVELVFAYIPTFYYLFHLIILSHIFPLLFLGYTPRPRINSMNVIALLVCFYAILYVFFGYV